MKKQNQFVQARKCCLTNGKFALLLFSSILLFTSCGNNLSKEKAKELINVNFPRVKTDWIRLSEKKTDDVVYFKNLVQADLLYQDNSFGNYNIFFKVLEKGKLFLLDNGKMVGSQFHFVTATIAFDKITGIVINKEEKSALVEYDYKYIGVTPFGELLGYQNNQSAKSTCKFKLYDDGWRIVDEKFDESKQIKDFTFFNDKGEYIGIK